MEKYNRELMTGCLPTHPRYKMEKALRQITEDVLPMELGAGRNTFRPKKIVKGLIYGDYKVEEKVAKNSNSLVVTSSSS